MGKPMFLIVGASLTGVKAAEELRGNGFDGRVMLVGGRVAAGMNVNVWNVNPQIEALIRAQEPAEVAALADPGVRLDSLAGELAAGS